MTHCQCYVSMSHQCVSCPLSNFLTHERHAKFSSSFCPSSVCLPADITRQCITAFCFIPAARMWVATNKHLEWILQCAAEKLCGCCVEKVFPRESVFPPAVSACVCSKTNRGAKIVADYQLNRCLIFSTLIMNQKECVVHTWAVTDSRYKDDLTCPRRKPGTAQGIPALRGRVCLASQGSPLWQNRSGNAAENDSRNWHIKFNSVWHRESQLCFFRASHSIRKSH